MRSCDHATHPTANPVRACALRTLRYERVRAPRLTIAKIDSHHLRVRVRGEIMGSISQRELAEIHLRFYNLFGGPMISPHTRTLQAMAVCSSCGRRLWGACRCRWDWLSGRRRPGTTSVASFIMLRNNLGWLRFTYLLRCRY
jgi:hypothetical protein